MYNHATASNCVCNISTKGAYIVVNFYFQLNFSFPLFLRMLMYCTEHKNKGKLKFNWKNLTTADTNRVIGGGNRGPADKPCQN